ncbi:MAG: hypothetical protein ACI9QC_000963 [Oceanicoccus sp.]|jgi:hypothetical protein
MNTKLGAKTQNLQKLLDLKFKVPSFVGISSSQFKSLEKALKEAHKNIGANTYAVRSSALNEDTPDQSMAGQFHTELEVKPENLLAAAEIVLKDAKTKLSSLNEFSIIIQEFIHFDYSGVCFTRDPQGAPEMIIESAAGGAEKVVQGEVTPDQKRVSWKDKTYPEFKAIELAFGHPQDIEWGNKSGQLYILQSRPITSLSTNAVDKIKVMNEALPKPPYFWEKNELTELAPQACTHTLELLKSIYAENGPVHQVYERAGIKYQSVNFLKMIGKELYVDKLEELHLLNPAYDLIDATPQIKRLKGLWTSIRNAWGVSRPKTRNANELNEELIRVLELPFTAISKKEFLSSYEVIFENNLLTGSLLQKLELIHKEQIELTRLLSEGASLLVLKFESPKIETTKWKGNTLDLSDKSKFQRVSTKTPSAQKKTIKWWESLSAIKKTQYTQLLPKLILAQHNRELGRQLVVKLKSQLDIKCEHSTKETDGFPSRLTSFVFHEKNSKTILSPGKATGRIIPLSEYKGEKDVILLVDELKPELIKYFSQVNGMITKRGGLLSHLAIVARESGFPILRWGTMPKDLLGENYEIST